MAPELLTGLGHQHDTAAPDRRSNGHAIASGPVGVAEAVGEAASGRRTTPSNTNAVCPSQDQHLRIDLSPASDGVRVIAEWPESLSGADLKYGTSPPSHVWPVYLANGALFGFLCVLSVYGKEEVRLAVYGENQGRISRVYFKRIPSLEAVVIEHRMIEQHQAALVIVGPGQEISSGLQERLCAFHVRVDAVLVLSEEEEEASRQGRSVETSATRKAPGISIVADVGDPSSEQSQAESGMEEQEEMEAAAVTVPPLEVHTSAGIRSSFSSDTGRSAEPLDRKPRDQAPGSSAMITVRAADVEARSVQWLWEERIALGKITLVAGEPGLAKSQLVAYFAATVSRGALWATSDHRAPKGSVVIVSTEDDIGDTIVPRLDAAGGDLESIHIFDRMNGSQGPRDFDLSRDLDDLERRVAEIDNVKLIVIDPLSAHLGRTDANSMTAVRTLLARLADLAARYGSAVVLIAHPNKRASSTAAIARVAGSGAFVAAVRTAYLIVKDPDNPGRRLLLPLKNNVGGDDTGLAFRVECIDLGSGLQAPRIRFEDEPVTETADEILRQTKPSNARAGEREEAKRFLLALLACGPVPSTTVFAEAEEAGLAARTLRRAADDLGIKRNKMGLMDGWEWALPDTNVATTKDHGHVATFEGGGHLRPDADGSGR